MASHAYSCKIYDFNYELQKLTQYCSGFATTSLGSSHRTGTGISTRSRSSHKHSVTPKISAKHLKRVTVATSNINTVIHRHAMNHKQVRNVCIRTAVIKQIQWVVLKLFTLCIFHQCLQFTASTKFTVLNTCQYQRCRSDMFRYKCAIFKENKTPGLKPIHKERLLCTRVFSL